MRLVLVVGHLSVANFEHVRVIPSSRPCVPRKSDLSVEDIYEGLVGPADVSGCSPGVADWIGPDPGSLLSPLAHRKEDRSSGRVEGVSHGRVPLG